MAWNVYIMGNAETPEEEEAALAFAQSLDLAQLPNVVTASFSGSLVGGTTFYESPAQTTEADATISAGTPEPQEVAPTDASATVNGDVDEQVETPSTE